MKRALLIVAIIAIATTGAFAQLTFGLSAQQYYQEDANGDLPSMSEAWADFRDGVGVYAGGFGELIFGQLGVGLSFNQQTFKDSMDSALDMWNYDMNFYASYHIFGGRAFIDPFLQAGFGVWAFDYVDKEAAGSYLGYTFTDDPLMGTGYMDLGLGCGINLGMVGIFVKGMWNIQSQEPLYSQDNVPLPTMDVMPFKWVFGAKVLL